MQHQTGHSAASTCTWAAAAMMHCPTDRDRAWTMPSDHQAAQESDFGRALVEVYDSIVESGPQQRAFSFLGMLFQACLPKNMFIVQRCNQE